MEDSEEKLKSFLMKSERGKWKSWLKTQHSKNKDQGIWSHHFMAIDGETMETVRDFIFLGSKITADGDCSREIKRCLLLGRKAMTNLDSILKSREITLPTKVHLVNTMVFLVVMYGCESWTIKKAEHQRTDAFELWYWKILESPLDCKEIKSVNPKGNETWIFIGKTDVEAKELTDILHTWYKELTHWKRPWCWARLKAEGEGDDRGWDGWMASLTRWTWVWASTRCWWWTGKLGVLQSTGSQSRTWLSNWTELNWWVTRVPCIIWTSPVQSPDADG